jgi:hypothetical protein
MIDREETKYGSCGGNKARNDLAIGLWLLDFFTTWLLGGNVPFALGVCSTVFKGEISVAMFIHLNFFHTDRPAFFFALALSSMKQPRSDTFEFLFLWLPRSC